MWVFAFFAVAYFLVDYFKESIFRRLKLAADPAASSEEFDFDAMAKWNQLEMIIDVSSICIYFWLLNCF